jgi:hypothetical protein
MKWFETTEKEEEKTEGEKIVLVDPYLTEEEKRERVREIAEKLLKILPVKKSK